MEDGSHGSPERAQNAINVNKNNDDASKKLLRKLAHNVQH